MRTRLFLIGLLISPGLLSGCASHKELTAPCKRPEGLASYAPETESASNPAARQLQRLAGDKTSCGPLYPVNFDGNVPQ